VLVPPDQTYASGPQLRHQRPKAEEIRDASVTLPKAIMWSVVINAILGFVMAITLIFTLGDIDSLFASVTRQPFIQLFYNATQSYAGTNAMTGVVIVLIAACCTSEVATASRQLWSFARDKGLPGSAWLSKVGPATTRDSKH
jgi:choline transport protein